MSYNLYLTHKKHWAQEEPAEKIPYAEFKKYIASYKGIHIEKEDEEAQTITLTYNLPKESGADVFYFKYDNGDVVTTSNHTDKYAFSMLVDIAEKFNVSIQGEEGELYTREDAETFGTYAEMQAKTNLRNDKLKQQKTEQLRSVKLSLKIYYVLLVVCVISMIGILLLPFPLFRIWQLKKSRALLLEQQKEN
ncbi:MAG TPA: hypothetical protein PKD20_01175 [Candidatus Saccharibacteria bacterium]|nr:hypothetical protein [Candidatus Saccharibacteria bacterium]HMT55468.1 hypothetical protein [Candidatus Saccharibacteria bacterium]